MHQVETNVLFIQDNPDFSALSQTPNKEETISNSTGLTATIRNGHTQLRVTTTTAKYEKTRSTDSQAYEGLTCHQTDIHLDPQIV